jgi:hypothetical protein
MKSMKKLPRKMNEKAPKGKKSMMNDAIPLKSVAPKMKPLAVETAMKGSAMPKPDKAKVESNVMHANKMANRRKRNKGR